jgi:hypothetical protein
MRRLGWVEMRRDTSGVGKETRACRNAAHEGASCRCAPMKQHTNILSTRENHSRRITHCHQAHPPTNLCGGLWTWLGLPFGGPSDAVAGGTAGARHGGDAAAGQSNLCWPGGKT